MTIAVAFLTGEGVVLGADSTTTFTDGAGNVNQLLNHAQKVFEVGQGTQCGLCTWGAGRVGDVAHRTIAARLGDDLHRMHNFDRVADRLCEIVEQSATPSAPLRGPLGYFLAGVESGTRKPRCIQVTFEPAGESLNVQRTELAMGTAVFQGAPNYFVRVFRGYDPELPQLLGDLLFQALAQYLPQNFAQNYAGIFNAAFNAAASRIRMEGTTAVPIREAIDYVHTYLHLTIKAFKFRVGPPVCGGPAEIAYITTDRPFRWARHKAADSAIEETGGSCP